MNILDQLKGEVQIIKDQAEEERNPTANQTGRTVATLAPLRPHKNHHHTSLITSLDDTLCHICSSKVGIYTCPRCLILYCGLSCYRSPSHRNCSEQFYKENVEGEMKGRDMRSDKEREGDIRQMITILNKFEINEETETTDEVVDEKTGQPKSPETASTDREWKYNLPKDLAAKKRQIEKEIEIEQRLPEAFSNETCESDDDIITPDVEASLEELVENASVQQLWELLTPEQRLEFAMIAKSNGVDEDEN